MSRLPNARSFFMEWPLCRWDRYSDDCTRLPREGKRKTVDSFFPAHHNATFACSQMMGSLPMFHSVLRRGWIVVPAVLIVSVSVMPTGGTHNQEAKAEAKKAQPDGPQKR